MATVPSNTYTVFVEDNFHYRDPDHRTEIPGFASAEEALAKCKSIIDACLEECAEPGRDAEQVFACYQSFGDDPWIHGPRSAPTVHFSAWTYAKDHAHRFVR